MGGRAEILMSFNRSQGHTTLVRAQNTVLDHPPVRKNRANLEHHITGIAAQKKGIQRVPKLRVLHNVAVNMIYVVIIYELKTVSHKSGTE